MLDCRFSRQTGSDSFLLQRSNHDIFTTNGTAMI